MRFSSSSGRKELQLGSNERKLNEDSEYAIKPVIFSRLNPKTIFQRLKDVHFGK